MFMVSLRFSENRQAAPRFMAAHNAWIDQGFADGVFLLVGGLGEKAGGFVLARGGSRSDLEQRVGQDPFVEQNVVTATIEALAPGRADTRLSFLLDNEPADG